MRGREAAVERFEQRGVELLVAVVVEADQRDRERVPGRAQLRRLRRTQQIESDVEAALGIDDLLGGLLEGECHLAGSFAHGITIRWSGSIDDVPAAGRHDREARDPEELTIQGRTMAH